MLCLRSSLGLGGKKQWVSSLGLARGFDLGSRLLKRCFLSVLFHITLVWGMLLTFKLGPFVKMFWLHSDRLSGTHLYSFGWLLFLLSIAEHPESRLSDDTLVQKPQKEVWKHCQKCFLWCSAVPPLYFHTNKCERKRCFSEPDLSIFLPHLQLLMWDMVET